MRLSEIDPSRHGIPDILLCSCKAPVMLSHAFALAGKSKEQAEQACARANA